MADSPAALRLINGVERDREGSDGHAPEDRGLAFTDKGNGERFARKHAHEVRFCTEWNKWLVWNGCWWAIDKIGDVMRKAKVIAAEIADEKVLGAGYEDLMKHCNKTQSLKGLDSMIRLASTELPIPITADHLDTHPLLFNCSNGTLDLETGEFRNPSKADLLTKHTPVAFDKDATCPTWLAFLFQMMGQDQSLVDFLQRAVGYSLTAKTTERALFLLYGKGRNGKSTFLEVVRALLGEYAMRIPAESLLQKERGGIPNDIARLKGARFVIASETDEGKAVAAAKLKELTGCDMVTARFMRSEFFDFMPEFKLWIGTNHKPRVPDSSKAFWDRVRLIPWKVRIEDGKEDPNLVNELKSELPGILNWALEGWHKCMESGLGTAAAITEATKEYEAEQDQIGNFLGEYCVVLPTASVSKGEMYEAYLRWCEAEKEWPVKKKTFGQRLDARDVRGHKTGAGHFWIGIGLKSALPRSNFPTEDRIRAESDRVAEEDDLFKVNREEK